MRRMCLRHAACAFFSLCALLIGSVSHAFTAAPISVIRSKGGLQLRRNPRYSIQGVCFHRVGPLFARKRAKDEDDYDNEADNYDDGDFGYDDGYEEEDENTRQQRYYEDIDQVTEAVKIYQKLFGTMRVNQKFTVPETSQWPRHLWGVKLGARLMALQKDEKIPRQIRSKLDAVGYKLRPSDVLDSWTVFLVALKAHKRMYDTVDVKTTFRIPKTKDWPAETHGYPLGGRVAMVKSIGRFVLGNPDRKKILDDLGFVWESGLDMKRELGRSWSHIRQAWFDVRRTNQTELDPDMIIPSGPSKSEDIRGMRIGSIYYSIQANADAFYESTFARKIIKELGIKFEIARRHTLQALKIYKRQYHHIDVPHMFAVPPADPWPLLLHRLPLGSFVRMIRQGMFAEDPNFKQELDNLGFKWKAPEHQPTLNETEEETTRRLQARINKILPNFYEFESKRVSYADMMDATVMAEDRIDLTLLDDLDRERYLFLRGIAALKRPTRDPESVLIEQSKQPFWKHVAPAEVDAHLHEAEVRKQMDGIAYWVMRQYNLTEPLEDYANKLPAPLLNETMGLEPLDKETEYTDYESKFNPYKDTKNLRIPYYMAAGYKLSAMNDAIINSPIRAEREEGWRGFDLRAQDISRLLQRRGTPEQQKKIRHLGYRLVEFEGWNFSDVLQALTAYKKRYRSLDVPEDYVLQEPAMKPGNRIYNMPLGAIVKRFQDGDVDGYDDPYRRKKLEEIGFKWTNPKEMLRFRWLPFIYGLSVHLEMEEHVDVQSDYVVPDSDLYPMWIRGLQLGKMADICRQQQNLLFKKFPKRAAMLEEYDFQWWFSPKHTTGFDEMLPDGTRVESLVAQPLPPDEAARLLENRARLDKMGMEMWLQWFWKIHDSDVVFPDPPDDKARKEWNKRPPKRSPWERLRGPSRTKRREWREMQNSLEGVEGFEKRELKRMEKEDELAGRSVSKRALIEDPRDRDEVDLGELTFS